VNEAPQHVHGLAEQRAKARAESDFATADILREEIEDAGWLVHDGADGFELTPKPPFKVWPTVASIPVPSAADQADQADQADHADREEAAGKRHPGSREHAAEGASRTPGVGDGTEAETGTENMVASQVLWDSTLAASRLDEAISAAATEQRHAEAPSGVVTVALLVDGHPGDVRTCLDALITYSDAKIIALDLGDVEGAGAVLHELAGRHPERIEAWHVAETPHWRGGQAGWGTSRNKLLQLDTGDVHVAMEISTILDGDAITPLVTAISGDVVAAGWKGVDPDDSGHDWREAGPGEVRGLLGHLLAVRRDKAVEAGGFPEKARYYRNADLEFSLALPGKLVVPDEALPVHQERHHAYDDVDPDYRDRESRRTYDRVLRLLRPEAGR
jgi:hypothetical protein